MNDRRRWTTWLLCSLLFVLGCTRLVLLPRNDYETLEGKESITVILKDGGERRIKYFRVENETIYARNRHEETAIPFADIAVIKVQKTAVGKTLLLAGGMVAGVIIIAEALTTPTPVVVQSNSCPYVYSFDGKDYHLDSETFSGALFAGAERSDLSNLEHLVPVDGTYRLRVANERDETEYTNQLTLLAIDHAQGLDIVGDTRGVLHSVRTSVPPIAAEDGRGRPVLPMVAARDTQAWESDPGDFDGAGGDLRRIEYPRDGVLLTFARPRGSSQAKLVVRARNTELGPLALNEFLELHGPGIYDWYGEANRSQAIQKQMRDWFYRDGMLRVSLWQDGEWLVQDSLIDVGPMLFKNQIATLDLSGGDGDSFLVRLDSGMGLWQIDAVRLDASPDEPLQVTELAPRSARVNDGRDMTHALAADDREYFVALPGDVADVLYDAPPVPPGRSRSVVLKSKGFYYIHTDDQRPANLELAAQLMSDPKAAAGYFLPKWKAVRAAQ